KHFGFSPEITYFSEDDLVAIADLKTSEREKDGRFKAITKRHTNRSLYYRRPIPQKHLEKLQECCEEGIRLDFITDEKKKDEIAELVAKGDLIQFNDKVYRRELGYWIGQGVFGHSRISALIAKFFVSHLNLGKSTAKKERKLIQSAPVFAVLSSEGNDRLTWVKIGEIYEKIALIATILGIQQHPMNQGLIEVPEHREKLGELLGIKEIPHFSFRLGYAEAEKHTPHPIVECGMRNAE
ncbi:MAG: hypothetical protein ACE5KE_04000, partial [Methanosarcinales archaeon]